MERPEPPAALWGYGGHSEPQPHRTPTVTLTHAHAHFHTHILYLTHTRPHTYTQVLIHTHTHNHPGNSKAAGISQCQAREENQGHRKTSSRCAWSLRWSWASPWLRGLGRPARLGLRKGDDVSTLAQSPASSCSPSGSLEHMLHGASWECQASPLHPPPSNHPTTPHQRA